MRKIVAFSCTRGRKEATDLHRSLERLGLESTFVEENRRGVSSCYNLFLEERAGSDAIGILAHDDVLIEDVFLLDKLTAGAEKFAIQGLAGSSSFELHEEGPLTWIRAPRPYLSGAVTHPIAPGVTFPSAYGPAPQRCAVLDGLFLAVDLAKIGDVRFDEQFAFHFYDLDFCLTAHKAGLAMGTVNVHALHRSPGDLTTPEFKAAQERFRAKWRGQI